MVIPSVMSLTGAAPLRLARFPAIPNVRRCLTVSSLTVWLMEKLGRTTICQATHGLVVDHVCFSRTSDHCLDCCIWNDHHSIRLFFYLPLIDTFANIPRCRYSYSAWSIGRLDSTSCWIIFSSIGTLFQCLYLGHWRLTLWLLSGLWIFLGRNGWLVFGLAT